MGTYNEWGLINNRNLFLTILEAGSPRSRSWQIQCLVRACFLVHRQPNFDCNLSQKKGESELCGAWYKGSNPTHESSTLMTPPQSPLSSNSIPLEIRFQHMNLGGHKYWLYISMSWSPPKHVPLTRKTHSFDPNSPNVLTPFSIRCEVWVQGFPQVLSKSGTSETVGLIYPEANFSPAVNPWTQTGCVSKIQWWDIQTFPFQKGEIGEKEGGNGLEQVQTQQGKPHET